MNEANYASLTAGLLARKGQAKPAMRPQNYGFGSDNDLGWNDMGGADLLTPEQRIALMPASPTEFPPVAEPVQPVFEPDAATLEADAEITLAHPASDVAQQSDMPAPAIQPVVEAPVVQAPVVLVASQPISVAPAPAPRPRAAPGMKSKAAFTLRLDPERHMQLRLACVYGRKSAQQIVIAALDEYLAANFPEAKGGRKATAN